MSIKDRRTKILLSLLLLGNKEYKPVVFTSVILGIFDLTLNVKTISMFKKMNKDNLLTMEISQDNIPTATITDSGFMELCLIFPFFRYTNKGWDGIWRVLSYEIPEKKRELRDKLRRVVSGWGLGPWHRSFWITPHPIISSLKSLVTNDEKEYIQAFEAQHVYGDRENLIQKVWDTSGLEKKYRRLFMKWHDVLSRSIEKPQKMKMIIDEYVEILKIDPGLPKELVGAKWIGFEAMQLFREIRNILM